MLPYHYGWAVLAGRYLMVICEDCELSALGGRVRAPGAGGAVLVSAGYRSGCRLRFCAVIVGRRWCWTASCLLRWTAALT